MHTLKIFLTRFKAYAFYSLGRKVLQYLEVESAEWKNFMKQKTFLINLRCEFKSVYQ